MNVIIIQGYRVRVKGKKSVAVSTEFGPPSIPVLAGVEIFDKLTSRRKLLTPKGTRSIINLALGLMSIDLSKRLFSMVTSFEDTSCVKEP